MNYQHPFIRTPLDEHCWQDAQEAEAREIARKRKPKKSLMQLTEELNQQVKDLREANPFSHLIN